MLDLVDETLDQVSFTIEPFVIGTSGFLMFGIFISNEDVPIPFLRILLMIVLVCLLIV